MATRLRSLTRCPVLPSSRRNGFAEISLWRASFEQEASRLLKTIDLLRALGLGDGTTDAVGWNAHRQLAKLQQQQQQQVGKNCFSGLGGAKREQRGGVKDVVKDVLGFLSNSRSSYSSAFFGGPAEQKRNLWAKGLVGSAMIWKR